MISEIDIQDWDHKIAAARQSVKTLKGPLEDVAADFLEAFLIEVEYHIRGQKKQMAALFKPKGDNG